MKLHSRVVGKLLNLFQNIGGHSDETKLKRALEAMDFTPYTRKTGELDTVLVETEDFLQESRGGQKI